ncbi:hypothetical protein [Reinekea marina]|uniref:hypothetical protein n=1 Tax=Reinekea marina TaxID=1310421 RepID=UPI003F491F1F
MVADGDHHCRSCGITFTIDQVKAMRALPNSVVGALPWNTRDRYRCVHCAKFICINDRFCRGCGDEICDQEKQLMKANLSELARNNLPGVISCMGFVVAFIAILYAINS